MRYALCWVHMVIVVSCAGFRLCHRLLEAGGTPQHSTLSRYRGSIFSGINLSCGKKRGSTHFAVIQDCHFVAFGQDLKIRPGTHEGVPTRVCAVLNGFK